MGTVVSLAIREAAETTSGSAASGSAAGEALADAVERALAILHHVDQVFSTWQPDSPVSRLRRG